jgi:integrase
LFVSERGGPMTASNVRKLIARAVVAAGFTFPVHPHMLRHACGYKLANDVHDTRALQHYLGHKPTRFGKAEVPERSALASALWMQSGLWIWASA